MAFWIFIVAVAAYVAAAGYTDFRMQRIPNYLTVPAAIAGLACSLLLTGNPTTWPDSLLGFGAGFAIFFLPFLLGGGGAGDLKLVSALGAWLGWFHLLLALAVSLIFATFFAIMRWFGSISAGRARAKFRSPSRSGETDATAKPKPRRRRGVRFAIPTALGTWCVLAGMVVIHLRPDLFQQPSRRVGPGNAASAGPPLSRWRPCARYAIWSTTTRYERNRQDRS